MKKLMHSILFTTANFAYLQSYLQRVSYHVQRSSEKIQRLYEWKHPSSLHGTNHNRHDQFTSNVYNVTLVSVEDMVSQMLTKHWYNLCGIVRQMPSITISNKKFTLMMNSIYLFKKVFQNWFDINGYMQ